MSGVCFLFFVQQSCVILPLGINNPAVTLDTIMEVTLTKLQFS